MDPYRHVKVPGFGCTYPNDFAGDSRRCRFELRRLVRDEVVDRQCTVPTIVLPIEAGRGTLKIGRNQYPLDSDKLVLLPPATDCMMAATTPILKLMSIEVSQEMIDACRDEFDLGVAKLAELWMQVRSISRTNWLNEVLHRYAFERAIAQRPYSASSAFLESEIVKEIYYGCLRVDQSEHDAPYFIDLPEPLRRALSFIEQNLQDSLSADQIASAAVTSKPTLVRLFRAHLGTSPIKYLWNRRLDEADRLLMTGRYSVSEVAVILGFSDSAAFSKSFTERFGVRPSTRFSR